MIQKTLTAILFGLSFSFMFVYAASPTLSVSPTGDGNTVTVNVTNADGNTPVVLFFNSTLYTGTQSQNIGNTTSNGTFSGVVSTSAYGITSSTQVYALINGYQTPYVTWPYNTFASSSSSILTFSRTNPSVLQGQTLVVTISGANGSYYISSNNNQNAVQASIDGNLLSFSGSNAGTATVVICSSTSICSNQVITVTLNSTSPGSLNVTKSNLTLTIGEATQIVVSGGTAPYSTFYDGTNKVTTSVNGTLITITGVSLGNTSVTLCGVSGGCIPIYVTVLQNSVPSQTISINVPIVVGQTLSMPLSGGSGTFYISTPIASPFNATLSGNKLYVAGTAVGTNTVTVCSSATLCSSITIAVSAGSNSTSATQNPPTPNSTKVIKYIFSNPLYLGMEGVEVKKLQERLVLEGYLSATPNGYYGPATARAVKAYQRDHDLSALGNVGPGTRAQLNR